MKRLRRASSFERTTTDDPVAAATTSPMRGRTGVGDAGSEPALADRLVATEDHSSGVEKLAPPVDDVVHRARFDIEVADPGFTASIRTPYLSSGSASKSIRSCPAAAIIPWSAVTSSMPSSGSPAAILAATWSTTLNWWHHASLPG